MDFNDINSQLADLTRDWERHKDAQQLYTNPEQQRKEEQIQAMRQFIPPSGTLPAGVHPSMHSYPSATNGTAERQQPQPSRAIYSQSQQQQPTPQLTQSVHLQQQQMQITAGHYQQLPQQVRQLQQDADPRNTMNERMGNFRFDHAGSTYGMPGLVPVNMDHIYSGNLFSEGLPVPQDLRDQFTLSAPGMAQTGARIQHQTKGKTMYRSDNNERLAALSPLGRALYYPVSGQGQTQPTQYQQPTQQSVHVPSWDSSTQYQPPTQQLAQQQLAQQQQQYFPGFLPQQQTIDYTSSGLARPQQPYSNHPSLQPQMNTRRSELRADINARIGQHPSLASAAAPESQMINMGSEPYYQSSHNPAVVMQPKKVMYQDMYPVMSK
jgi:hypothetical protein